MHGVTSTRTSLDKCPYAVLFRVAQFLPPAGNFQLKRASRTLCDVVGRLTEHWIVPFVFLRSGHECEIGVFRFATMAVELCDARVPAPDERRRAGKAVTYLVDDGAVENVAMTCAWFAAPFMRQAAALECPMPHTVMIFCDKVRIADATARAVKYFLSRVPSTRPVPRPDSGDWPLSATAAPAPPAWSELGEMLAERATREALATAALQRQGIVPATAAAAAVGPTPPQPPPPSPAPAQVDGPAGSLANPRFWKVPIEESTSFAALFRFATFSPAVITRHILRSVFGIDATQSATQANRCPLDGAIEAKSAADATMQCGRPCFAELFADECTHRSHSRSLAGRESMRREFGVTTSSSLAQLLRCSSSWSHVPLEAAVPPRFQRAEAPTVDGLQPPSDDEGWKDVIFRGPVTAEPAGPEFATPSDGAAACLRRMLHKDERLLVGEDAAGTAVVLPLAMVLAHFQRVEHAYEDGVRGGPVGMTLIEQAWSVATAEQLRLSGGPLPRPLYVADDVTLGTVYNATLYEPCEMIRRGWPWAKAASSTTAAVVATATTAKPPPLPARVLTPWLLIGEPGTFSAEHVEPHDLHVWVHLFVGVKLWFVEAKPELLRRMLRGADGLSARDVVGRATATALLLQQTASDDPQQWTLLVQRAGDTFVVPPRWRHFVLNVTPTFAVARNFAWTS